MIPVIEKTIQISTTKQIKVNHFPIHILLFYFVILLFLFYFKKFLSFFLNLIKNQNSFIDRYLNKERKKIMIIKTKNIIHLRKKNFNTNQAGRLI